MFVLDLSLDGRRVASGKCEVKLVAAIHNSVGNIEYRQLYFDIPNQSALSIEWPNGLIETVSDVTCVEYTSPSEAFAWKEYDPSNADVQHKTGFKVTLQRDSINWAEPGASSLMYNWKRDREKGLTATRQLMREAGGETLTADADVEEKTFCYKHPTVETALRCNRCGQYICSRCAVRTPVGYRCDKCVRQQQDTFFTASTRDYAIAGVVAFALGIPATFILARGGLFITIILGLPIGGLISEAVHRASGKRRGRYTAYVVAAGVVLGAVVANYQTIGAALDMGQDGLTLLIYPAIAAAICAGAAAARFRFGK